jgi:hypothetical protein
MMAKRLKKERSTPLSGRAARKVRAAARFVAEMKERKAAGKDGTTVIMVYFTADDRPGERAMEVFCASDWKVWTDSRAKWGRLSESRRGKLRVYLGNTNDDRAYYLLPRHVDALLSMVGDII